MSSISTTEKATIRALAIRGKASAPSSRGRTRAAGRTRSSGPASITTDPACVVAFAIARREPAGAQKQSCRGRLADAWIWAEALVRLRGRSSRFPGLSERRRCARPPWGRRGDRFRRMRSCRSPAPPAARGYRVGAGTVGLPGGSSGVSVASTSMLLAQREQPRRGWALTSYLAHCDCPGRPRRDDRVRGKPLVGADRGHVGRSGVASAA